MWGRVAAAVRVLTHFLFILCALCRLPLLSGILVAENEVVRFPGWGAVRVLSPGVQGGPEEGGAVLGFH